MKVEIVEARLNHCGQMARMLRSEHLKAIALVGANIHRELRARFFESSYRKSLIVDGKLAAMGGVTGPAMSSYGYAWFALSNEASRRPVLMVKVVKNQIEEIMRTRHELATTIISDDAAGRRLAVFLGFHSDHDGPGMPAHSRFGRRNLQRYLETNPDIRIPVGNGYAIPLGYHRDDDPATLQ